MQLNLERPDYTWFLRGADGRHALVNERMLERSFVIAPESLVEDWPVTDATAHGSRRPRRRCWRCSRNWWCSAPARARCFRRPQCWLRA